MIFLMSEIEVYSDKHRHNTETKGTRPVSLRKNEADHKKRLITDSGLSIQDEASTVKLGSTLIIE